MYRRAEFGARALGNRSIIANPKNTDNIKKINNLIKNRDFWMPFTPSILSEKASLFLKNDKNIIFALHDHWFLKLKTMQYKI